MVISAIFLILFLELKRFNQVNFEHDHFIIEQDDPNLINFGSRQLLKKINSISTTTAAPIHEIDEEFGDSGKQMVLFTFCLLLSLNIGLLFANFIAEFLVFFLICLLVYFLVYFLFTFLFIYVFTFWFTFLFTFLFTFVYVICTLLFTFCLLFFEL